MKTVFGVEWFHKQEDFDEAIEKLKAMLKDGDESEIIYIDDEDPDQNHRLVLAKGEFIPDSDKTKMKPVILVNHCLLMQLEIEYNQNKHMLVA